MRDFSWTYFAKTGDVDAYLLYKEVCASDLDEVGMEIKGEVEPFDAVQTES